MRVDIEKKMTEKTIHKNARYGIKHDEVGNLVVFTKEKKLYNNVLASDANPTVRDLVKKIIKSGIMVSVCSESFLLISMF